MKDHWGTGERKRSSRNGEGECKIQSMKQSVIVFFDKQVRRQDIIKVAGKFPSAVAVAPRDAHKDLEPFFDELLPIEDHLEPGSVYEGASFCEKLSLVPAQGGKRITSVLTYKGYELWWIYYNMLFLYYGLPFTQYKKLLEFLAAFEHVHLHNPPFERLFRCYLEAHEREFSITHDMRKSPRALPFGMLLQILLTILFLPFVILLHRPVLLFTGDKFDKGKDYDFRMQYLYEELRKRKIPFVESIRSLEPWRPLLRHAFKRKRPVIYPEAVMFIGRFISTFLGNHRRTKRAFRPKSFLEKIPNAQDRFLYLVATEFLLGGYDDIWAIRITKWILRVIGTKAAIVVAANERNFHTVIAAKLNNTPITGILHGFASRYYNVYDFMPTFEGKKTMSVDKYGVWSDWWKEYYLQHGAAYSEDQLVVSGPMRPREKKKTLPDKADPKPSGGKLKVLFISEQLAVPEEVLPYLEALIAEKSLDLYIKFRPYRDGFELWLKENRPDILECFAEKRILRGAMKDAIAECDIVVGSHSTAVLEALFDAKPIALFATGKWGDFFELKTYDAKTAFYAETPQKFIQNIRNAVRIPKETLFELQERFFGDPYKNGSRWVIEEVERVLEERK